MRVSRTRFSKRRLKRKTEFPIVAVVQKKRKPEYSLASRPSFGAFGTLVGYRAQNGEASNAKHSFTMVGKKTNLPDSSTRLETKRETISTREEKESILLDKNQKQTTPENFVEGDKATTALRKKLEKRNPSKPQKKSRATIDYKNVILLRNLITAEGKILPRRINKLTAKQQRYVEKAIKTARIMGLVPFINKSRPFSNP